MSTVESIAARWHKVRKLVDTYAHIRLILDSTRALRVAIDEGNVAQLEGAQLLGHGLQRFHTAPAET